MTEVASRELRNDAAGLIRRAAAGEDIVITVNGRPTVRLTALPAAPWRRQWIPREEVLAWLLTDQGDPGLRDDLERYAGDTTDDLEPLT